MSNARSGNLLFIKMKEGSFQFNYSSETTLFQIKELALNQAKLKNPELTNYDPLDFKLIFTGIAIGESEMDEHTPIVTVAIKNNFDFSGSTTLLMVLSPNPRSKQKTASKQNQPMQPAPLSTSTAMTTRRPLEISFGGNSFSINMTESMTVNDAIRDVLNKSHGYALNSDHFQLITKDGWSLGINKNANLHRSLNSCSKTKDPNQLQLITMIKKKTSYAAPRPLRSPIYTWLVFDAENNNLKQGESSGVEIERTTYGQAFFKTEDAALQAYGINVALNLKKADAGFTLNYKIIENAPVNTEALKVILMQEEADKKEQLFPLLMYCSQNKTYYLYGKDAQNNKQVTVIASPSEKNQWEKSVEWDTLIWHSHPKKSGVQIIKLSLKKNAALFSSIRKHHITWRKERALIAAVAIDKNQPGFFESEELFIEDKYKVINDAVKVKTKQPAGFLAAPDSTAPSSRFFRQHVSEFSQLNFGQRNSNQNVNSNHADQLVNYSSQPSLPVVCYGVNPKNFVEAGIQYTVLGYYLESDDTSSDKTGSDETFYTLVDENHPDLLGFLQEHPFITVTSVNNLKNYELFTKKQSQMQGFRNAKDQIYRITFKTETISVEQRLENSLKFSLYGEKVKTIFFKYFYQFLKEKNLANEPLSGDELTLTAPEQKNVMQKYFNLFLKYLKDHTIVDDIQEVIQTGGTEIIGYDFSLKSVFSDLQIQNHLLDYFRERMQSKYGIAPTTSHIAGDTKYETYHMDPQNINKQSVTILVGEVLNMVMQYTSPANAPAMGWSSSTSSTPATSTAQPQPNIYSSQVRQQTFLPPPEKKSFPFFDNIDNQEKILAKLREEKNNSYLSKVLYLLEYSKESVWQVAVLRACASYFKSVSNNDLKTNQVLKSGIKAFIASFDIVFLDQFHDACSDMLREKLVIKKTMPGEQLDPQNENRKKLFNDNVNKTFKDYLEAKIPENPIILKAKCEMSLTCLRAIKAQAEEINIPISLQNANFAF